MSLRTQASDGFGWHVSERQAEMEDPSQGVTLKPRLADVPTSMASNVAVLGRDSADTPPCARNLIESSLAKSSKLTKAFWAALDSLPGLPSAYWNGKAVEDVLHSRQLFSSVLGLPASLAESRHVYLFTAPRQDWPVPYHHWSIYSQGYFFHLSADLGNVPIQALSEPCGMSSTKARKAQINLKVEDLSNQSMPEYLAAAQHAKKKPFIAFEVGCTRFSAEDMESIGQCICDKLATYDLLEANCQIFTHAMLCRVVMSQRDCSTFVGGKTQFVDWDLSRSLTPESMSRQPYSRDSGFLVRQPIPPGERRWTSLYPLYYFTAVGVMQHAKQIRRLYEGGPLSIGAYDPSGKLSFLEYVWSKFSVEMKGAGSDLRRTLHEFREDLIAGRFGDAYHGREELRQERMEAVAERKLAGERFSIEGLILRAFARKPARESTQSPAS